MESIWKIKSADAGIVQELGRQLNISTITAALLYQRGITTVRQAQKFLEGGLTDLSDPFSLTGMAESIARIETAVQQREKVIIYGDYDVDGICSIAILKDCLAALNCEADYYVPDRFSQGYGINEQAIRAIAAQGYSLLISVDCGITSLNEVNIAASLGMDCIITDHHTPGGGLPPAVAVINPKLDKPGAISHLAGAGVAFMLARALGQKYLSNKKVFEWLDVVALATVADIVPLQGDNRILAKEGLLKLQNTHRPGLQALLQETGLTGKPLSTWQVSFILAPRLNSAGRVENAATSVELLLATDPARCLTLAQTLCRLNDERKAIENSILTKALEQIEAEVDLETEPFLVLAGEGWHQGVLGIVASRLCEKFTRLVVLISWDGDTGRGSARSVADLDLYQALNYAREHLVQFGGHKMAAGLTINRDQFPAFKHALQEWTANNGPMSVCKQMEADLEIDIKDINMELCNELERLQPFGEGNSAPALVARGCRISSLSRVGKNGEHIKYRIGEPPLECIAFNHVEWLQGPLRQCRQDILFEPAINEFRGFKNVQLRIKDMKSSYRPDTGWVRIPGMASPFVRLAEHTAGELKAGHPVVFVYPTCRSITRHKLAVNSYFNPGIIKELHGQLGRTEQKAADNVLRAGEPYLFLMTETYLRHYYKEANLPDGLKCLAWIWPEAPTLIDKEWHDRYNITVLPVVNQIRLINRPDNWNPEGKRILVYANRKKSLPRTNSGFPSFIEAGLTNIQDRRAARRGFAACPSGALWWDGSTSCLPSAGDINAFVLLDVPYGLYELTGAYTEMAASAEVPAIMAFKPEDMAFNRSYLNRLCPSPDTIMGVWRYIHTFPGNSLRQDINRLCKDLSGFLDRNMTWAEIAPIIQILGDLDLCKMAKQGSIIEIKFIKSEILPPDINNSLYYLEGLAEKTVYYKFEEELIKNWSGDIYGT